MEFIACNTDNYRTGRTQPRWNIDAYIHDEDGWA